MYIVVIGLGSMGKRRIRLLKQYIQEEVTNEEEWKIIGVDSNKERCIECAVHSGIEVCSSLEEAIANHRLDCAIISTSPVSHAKIIKTCLEASLHVFTEINLVDEGYDENIDLAKRKNKVLFLSSTFLYRKEVEHIKKQVEQVNFQGMYHYHIGQYLPEWHPWESYKDYFVGSKRTNGCREILAIELPWLIDTFGEVKSFYSKHRKLTNLEIDYDDCYQIMLEHKSGVMGCLIVDVVTPKTGRKFEMWQENFCVSWEGTPDTITEYNAEKKAMEAVCLYDNVKHEQGYNQFIVENAYYDELNNFFEVIAQKDISRYSFEKDKTTLILINNIEK